MAAPIWLHGGSTVVLTRLRVGSLAFTRRLVLAPWRLGSCTMVVSRRHCCCTRAAPMWFHSGSLMAPRRLHFGSSEAPLLLYSTPLRLSDGSELSLMQIYGGASATPRWLSRNFATALRWLRGGSTTALRGVDSSFASAQFPPRGCFSAAPQSIRSSATALKLLRSNSRAATRWLTGGPVVAPWWFRKGSFVTFYNSSIV